MEGGGAVLLSVCSSVCMLMECSPAGASASLGGEDDRWLVDDGGEG